ncbi:unnamed protein product, partial [Brassica rapa subsp. trilocularis]
LSADFIPKSKSSSLFPSLHTDMLSHPKLVRRFQSKQEFQQGEGVDLTYSVDMATNFGNTIDRRTRVRIGQTHQQLKDDLIENIWAIWTSSK